MIDESSFNLASVIQASSEFPIPQQFKALTGTGAQATTISNSVVNALVHVPSMVPAPAPANLLPSGSVRGGDLYINPNAIVGAEITSTGGMFDVLLGMDILSGSSLKIEGNGTFSFCT